MSSIFCCGDVQSYKNRTLSHEPKFKAFMSWTSFPTGSSIDPSIIAAPATFAIQVVNQTNYGPLDSKRYFVTSGTDGGFVEVTEQWLIDANFEKLNTYLPVSY
ncbi:hypothetical protein NX059_004142 [Plenodomus lindquistii]|nr:hypothetical protein NX059_004142 [Plenodomus lindquistii]